MPAEKVPTEIVGPPRRGGLRGGEVVEPHDGGRELNTAFSPRCGIDPWAVFPRATASAHTTPLCATHG